MKINIVRPSAVWHPEVFNEFCNLLEYSLAELGYEVSTQFDGIDQQALNIFISFFFSSEIFRQAPSNSIVFQVENLAGQSDYTERQIKYITEKAIHFQVWDYSPANIEVLKSHGISNLKLFEFGFAKKLERYRPRPIGLRPLDVLFYGRINEHRRSILADMAVLGVKVKMVKSLFGAERDALMISSKLVLNLHDYNASNFEIFRAHYPLNNGIPILSEINADTSIIPNYLDYIFSFPAEEIALKTRELLSTPSVLDQESERQLSQFAKSSQSEILKVLLA